MDFIVTGASDGAVRLWAVKRNGRKTAVKLLDEVARTTVAPVSYCTGAAISRKTQDIVFVAYALPIGTLIATQFMVDIGSGDAVKKLTYQEISFLPAFVVSIATHIVSNGKCSILKHY
ncbi:unnamed protein product [Gongylonema pulchrum]|uniref:Uncharacterized protein n=1 Tax=Gongylonema pulchrum TaxID=637853 RepID=A0A3P6SJ35_9BILA|nr:unnamed protein product [Gongylonema pulchrum]